MSEKYTKQELLLLSNFVYIPACLSTKPIKEIIDSYRDENGEFTEESVLEAARGGGMSCADVRTVFTEMDKRIRDNPDLGSLSASRILDEYDVRAICYTDEKDNDPVVAFRGTGGTRQAWSDNFEGAFYEDTRIQQTASDFIENECAIYKDIVVTGHSKGGNLAQYVTVKQQEMISSCVSFDGQGFGDDFIRNNMQQIETAASKITSISAYNDFVNILLTGIAGTCIYVANDSSAQGAHSPVTLLTHNTFDENGDFTSIRRQGAVSAQLEHLTDRICDVLAPLSIKDKESMGMIAGTAVSLALSTPRENLAEGCIAPTTGLVMAELVKKIGAAANFIAGEEPLSARNVFYDPVSVTRASRIVADQAAGIDCIIREVDRIRQNMAFTITARICAEHVLERVCYDLSQIKEDLTGYSRLIVRIGHCYDNTELEAVTLMNL